VSGLARPAALLALVAALSVAGGPLAAAAPKAEKMQTLLQPNRSPLVTFRLLFRAGAADDPPGKEGLAALTAALVAGGGTRDLTYDQVVRVLYPMAASFSAQTDKEMTVFSGTSHVETLDAYYGLVRKMLLEPGFRADDFARAKADAINYLKVSLRGGNDEELGKEALYLALYRDHPYGHANVGRVGALESITLDDVRAFYAAHYARSNLTIGLAGGYPKDFPERVAHDFEALAAEAPAPPALPTPKLDPGWRVEVLTRETRSTAISLGFPVAVTRADKDWPALALAASYLGQHRSSNSHLYQVLREARGLNYGDYAYVEYFPRGGSVFEPDPNLGRRQQIFQIWIRPVEPQNAVFALRAAKVELDRLVRDGLTAAEFEATRKFLVKNASILTGTQDARLGYALDSAYYGTPEYVPFMRDALAKLTLDDVNAAIRRHLGSSAVRVVMVTKDGEDLRSRLVSGDPSPIVYNSPKPKEVLEEDKTIERYPLPLKPEDVTIVPADRVFE
jgi:zinc protease